MQEFLAVLFNTVSVDWTDLVKLHARIFTKAYLKKKYSTMSAKYLNPVR